MATVVNKTKVLSVVGKVKMIIQIKMKKIILRCRKFGLVNSTIQRFGKIH